MTQPFNEMGIWRYERLYQLSTYQACTDQEDKRRPGISRRGRGGCKTQFCRLKLELTLNLPTEIDFEAKNGRLFHKNY